VFYVKLYVHSLVDKLKSYIFYLFLRIILKMSLILDESSTENQTHFVFGKFFFRKSCRL